MSYAKLFKNLLTFQSIYNLCQNSLRSRRVGCDACVLCEMNTAVLEGSRVTSSSTLTDITSIESNNGDLSDDFKGVDRCCCRIVHIKVRDFKDSFEKATIFQRGTYLISFLSAFFIVTNLLMKIAGYSETAWDWELVFLVVDTIALASMFFGIYSERAAFIQPFVVLSVCFYGGFLR